MPLSPLPPPSPAELFWQKYKFYLLLTLLSLTWLSYLGQVDQDLNLDTPILHGSGAVLCCGWVSHSRKWAPAVLPGGPKPDLKIGRSFPFMGRTISGYWLLSGSLSPVKA